MKLRSAWRIINTNWVGERVDIYYTNHEYKAMKSIGYDMSHYQRVFVVTTFKFDSHPYSGFFPPF